MAKKLKEKKEFTNAPTPKTIIFNKAIVITFSVITVLMLISFWVLKPSLLVAPERDSGAFLYVGQQILNGSIPYKEVWDHKPPIVFFINALGILFTPESFKGVFYLQVFFTGLAAILGFFTLKNSSGYFIAFLSSVIFLYKIIDLNEGSNETEQWSLWTQFGGLYLLFSKNKHKHFFIGTLAGIALMLRQNLISFWVALFIFELIVNTINKKSLQGFFINQAKIFFGATTVIIPFLIYFSLNGALKEFWDVAFRFNLIYTKTEGSFKHAFLKGVSLLGGYYIIIMYLFLLVAFIRFKNILNYKQTILIILIWFPIEIYLSTISLRESTHYYLSWLPAVCSMIALFFYCTSEILNYYFVKNRQLILCSNISLMIVFTTVLIKPCIELRKQQFAHGLEYQQNSMFRERVADYIKSNTAEGDFVMDWGIVDSINFLSGRKSPTRFFYPYALDSKGYTNDILVEEFIDDIIKNNPKIILDTSKGERLPPLDSKLREEFYQTHPNLRGLIPKNIDKFYKFVEENYVLSSNIGYFLFYQHK